MTRVPEPGRTARGFTLTELAVAVLILGLLIGGLLIPLSTQYDISQTRETQRQLEAAREALIGFAIANGRLPCPADPLIASGTPNAGIEQAVGGTCGAAVMNANQLFSGNPRRATGVLPWTTLGLPETDVWGRRFNYVVDEGFANTAAECANPPLTTPQPTLCPTRDSPTASLSIVTRPTAGVATVPVANEVVAVVVSPGKNGAWGFIPNGTRPNIPANANRDERLNSAANLGTGGTSFAYTVQRLPLRTAAACNDFNPGAALCEFDDQVVWVSRNMLVARMAAANRF